MAWTAGDGEAAVAAAVAAAGAVAGGAVAIGTVGFVEGTAVAGAAVGSVCTSATGAESGSTTSISPADVAHPTGVAVVIPNRMSHATFMASPGMRKNYYILVTRAGA